jgi:hypothetical protein
LAVIGWVQVKKGPGAGQKTLILRPKPLLLEAFIPWVQMMQVEDCSSREKGGIFQKKEVKFLDVVRRSRWKLRLDLE